MDHVLLAAVFNEEQHFGHVAPLLAAHFVLRVAFPSPAGLGLCSVAGYRERTHRPGQRSRNAPGNARARSPPGAPPEAAKATTGRGGERAVSQPRWPGLLPHRCLSPDRSSRPAAQTLCSCRRRRGRSGFLCLPRQVRSSPATELPALLQPVAGVVSGSRDGERKGGLVPWAALPRRGAELLPHPSSAGSRRPLRILSAPGPSRSFSCEARLLSRLVMELERSVRL